MHLEHYVYVLLVLNCILVEGIPVQSRRSKYCGTQLSEALKLICSTWGYGSPPWDSQPASTPNGHERGRRDVDDGIVTECCHRGCSYHTLATYCRNDGNPRVFTESDYRRFNELFSSKMRESHDFAGFVSSEWEKWFGQPTSSQTLDSDDHNYMINLNQMDERQFDKKFEEMLADMNLMEDKKMPLRKIDTEQNKHMLIAYNSVKLQEDGFNIERPLDYITYLSRPELTVDELTNCLQNLRIALSNHPLTWLEEFGEQGISRTVTILNSCYGRDESYNRVQLECIKCYSAFADSTTGIRLLFNCSGALSTLARSIDPSKPHCMLKAVKLLSAMCLIPGGHEKVLEAITVAGEIGGYSRFQPIIKGLAEDGSDELKFSCMQMINAIIDCVYEDLEYRMHLRNELMRTGLYELIDSMKKSKASGPMKTQLSLFDNAAENDHEELVVQFDKVRLDMQDINECFELIKNSTLGTTAEPYFLSILQHLLFIKGDNFVRTAYYNLIEECITQIVLHKNGCDPDLRATSRFKIDVMPLIEGLLEKFKLEKQQKLEEIGHKLEDAVTAKKTAEAECAYLKKLMQQIIKSDAASLINDTSMAAIVKIIGPSSLPHSFLPNSKISPPFPLVPPIPGGPPPPPMSGGSSSDKIPLPPPMFGSSGGQNQ